MGSRISTFFRWGNPLIQYCYWVGGKIQYKHIGDVEGECLCIYNFCYSQKRWRSFRHFLAATEKLIASPLGNFQVPAVSWLGGVCHHLVTSFLFESLKGRQAQSPQLSPHPQLPESTKIGPSPGLQFWVTAKSKNKTGVIMWHSAPNNALFFTGHPSKLS